MRTRTLNVFWGARHAEWPPRIRMDWVKGDSITVGDVSRNVKVEDAEEESPHARRKMIGADAED